MVPRRKSQTIERPAPADSLSTDYQESGLGLIRLGSTEEAPQARPLLTTKILAPPPTSMILSTTSTILSTTSTTVIQTSTLSRTTQKTSDGSARESDVRSGDMDVHEMRNRLHGLNKILGLRTRRTM